MEIEQQKENVMEILEDTNTTKKIYKKSMVFIGTLLGGPLAGGYFIAENFKALNKPDKAIKTWNYTIKITIILYFFGLIYIPEQKYILILILLILGIFAYLFVKDYQDTTDLSLKGKPYSLLRVIFVSLIMTIILIVLVLFFIPLSNVFKDNLDVFLDSLNKKNYDSFLDSFNSSPIN